MRSALDAKPAAFITVGIGRLGANHDKQEPGPIGFTPAAARYNLTTRLPLNANCNWLPLAFDRDLS